MQKKEIKSNIRRGVLGVSIIIIPCFACKIIKGKLSREAHALASCENLKSVRLTFFKLN